MPQQAEEEQVEGQENLEQGQQQEGQQAQQQQEQASQPAQQQQIDWDSESNPYFKRYRDSQSQIQPLVRTLNQFAEYDHTTKTWKPKTQQATQPQTASELAKMLEGYDPEFVKALDGYISPLKSELQQLKQEREQSAFLQEYNSKMQTARSDTMKEFGNEFEFVKDGKFNTTSPLYRLANEILTAKYAQFNPDGTFHRYATPDAEYLATVEAYAILVRRAKQQPAMDNGKLKAIQGKGSKSSAVGKKLSYEEYSKLSEAEKDAYDLQQNG